jgi:hypothetical protein
VRGGEASMVEIQNGDKKVDIGNRQQPTLEEVGRPIVGYPDTSLTGTFDSLDPHQYAASQIMSVHQENPSESENTVNEG